MWGYRGGGEEGGEGGREGRVREKVRVRGDRGEERKWGRRGERLWGRG